MAGGGLPLQPCDILGLMRGLALQKTAASLPGHGRSREGLREDRGSWKGLLCWRAHWGAGCRQWKIGDPWGRGAPTHGRPDYGLVGEGHCAREQRAG